MSEEYINPEYSVTDENQYLPQDSFSYKKKHTTLVVINNTDGSNGVTMYDGDDQVVKVLIDGNAKLSADKTNRTATLKVRGDKILPGEGILVDEDDEEGTKTVSQDKEWLAEYVKHDLKVVCNIKAKKDGGILVSDDPDDENTKILELDDNYVVNQGEF